MPALRIAVDLHGVDPDRPRGPARYARALAEALAQHSSEHELTVWEPGAAPGAADVVIALGGRPRVELRVPTVAAVYDLAHLLAPSTLPRLERMRRGFEVAWLTRRAAHLVAPSLGLAHALARYLRVPDQRLTWLPSVGPGWRRASRAEVEAARDELAIGDRYVLFVGTLSRRKNLQLLVAAWCRARPDAELVICGEGDLGRAGVELPEGSRHLGYVPDRLLHGLLSGALAWASPSRCEGCSIGALEAMACGAPPLVASGTALAEVVGTSGIVIDPDDVEGWAAAIQTVLVDREERNRMAARGLQVVRELRPEDAALRLLRAAETAAAAVDR